MSVVMMLMTGLGGVVWGGGVPLVMDWGGVVVTMVVLVLVVGD